MRELIESKPRQELTFTQEIAALKGLQEQHGMTLTEIASQIGRNEKWLRLKLMVDHWLTSEEKQLLDSHELTFRKATAIAKLRRELDKRQN